MSYFAFRLSAILEGLGDELDHLLDDEPLELEPDEFVSYCAHYHPQSNVPGDRRCQICQRITCVRCANPEYYDHYKLWICYRCARDFGHEIDQNKGLPELMESIGEFDHLLGDEPIDPGRDRFATCDICKQYMWPVVRDGLLPVGGGYVCTACDRLVCNRCVVWSRNNWYCEDCYRQRLRDLQAKMR